MLQFRKCLIPFLAATLSQTFPGWASAEQIVVSVLAPWTAEGKVYKVSPTERQFVGAFRGIMYTDKKEGEIDTALFVCPTVHLLDMDSNRTEANGRCHIVATEGNIFGEFRCTGEPGRCDGQFEITAGSDEFAGITGSGEMKIRVAIDAMLPDATSGDVVAKAEGLAVWPNLTVNLPKRE